MELLNLTNMSNGQVAASEHSGEALPISLAEVTKVLKKLLGNKAPGVDEIYPDTVTALDIAGLSWLTHLLNVAWRLGKMSVDWHYGWWVQNSAKGDWRGN